MGVDMYAQVRKMDGNLTSEISEETRAVLAGIISGQGVLIDDVREFEAFQAGRVDSWDDPELGFEQWEKVNAHPFWWALDMVQSNIMVLGRAKGSVAKVLREMGYDSDGHTQDKREIEIILVALFDEERGVQLARILDGLYWA